MLTLKGVALALLTLVKGVTPDSVGGVVHVPAVGSGINIIIFVFNFIP